MAFTTAPLPMDKDQGAFWQGNDDLFVANDSFFDQYVSFETAEPTAFDCASFESPPSPSILLDSLDCLTNSSDGQGQLPAQSHPVEAAARPGPPMFAAQHARSVPALYDHQPDLALGPASISDSELLRLEGISLCSPRVHNSASSSPRLMPSSPSSPRRNRRFLDAVHTTVPRAAHCPSAPAQALAAAPNLDVKTEPGHHDLLPQPQNVPDGLMGPAYWPVDCHGLPLSPPLTGKLPTESQQLQGTPFVTGHLEDPFSEGYVALHPARTQAHGECTPLYTPVFRSDAFRHASQPMDLAPHPVFQPHKQRSTSSAEWPVESSAAPSAEGAKGAPPTVGFSHHNTHGLARRTRPAPGRPYEGPYEPADGLAGGLMIHMPQPQPPPAAASLLAGPEPPLGTPTTPRCRATAAYPATASTTASSPHRMRGLYTDRRPLPPRAPASGARHLGTSLTSPRKPSTLHHSASRPLLAHHARHEDEPPASPTPSRRRSSSMSVRKQRSWSRREPRTPNVPPSSSTMMPPTTPTASNPACSPGLGGVDFVNFTPSDKTVLMHGVAPSGSSKTKARREKEALDRRRKLSEAAYKAVQAAGGDIERLRAEVSTL